MAGGTGGKGKGPLQSARSQLIEDRSMGPEEWARFHGAMGPRGCGAMSHGREGREGLRGGHAMGPWAIVGGPRGMAPWDHAEPWTGRVEGAGMHWGPLWDHEAMGP